MMRIAVVSLGFLLAAGAAQAQRVSNVQGITLMKACTGATKEACDAYVDGFGDAIEAEGKANALACIPIAATGTELRDVLISYMKAHPEVQHVKAADIARRAFSKAYPCSK